jgi:hypothetical protein
MSALAFAEQTVTEPEPAAVAPPPEVAIGPESAPALPRGSFGEHVRAANPHLLWTTVAMTVPRAISLAKSNSGFSFKSEGWFGRNRNSVGMDKLMHAYEGYVVAEFLGSAIRRQSSAPGGWPVSAGLISFGLMTYTEVLDGFGGDRGFSHEDFIADFTGAAVSVLRNSIPGLKDKLDIRIQYVPSDLGDTRLLTDYAGQKYLLALQMSGFRGMERSPLRLVELHAGYYARGFRSEDKAAGKQVRRELFVGIGLNVQELLFGQTRSRAGRAAHSVLDYVQVPYTSANIH